MENNEKKYFEVIIRDCSCDEEDKTYTYTVYYIAKDEDQVRKNIKLDYHFEWIKQINELKELPKRHNHKVVELI